MLDEFKKFAMRGNVVDLAVGAAHGRGGVELLGDRHEGHTMLVEQLDEFSKVRQRAGQAVDLVDDDHVDLAARFRRLCNETRTPRTGTGHKAKGAQNGRSLCAPFPFPGCPRTRKGDHPEC